MHPLLKIGDRISVLPVIHGSADSALQVRQHMLEQDFDCVAVPLPPSFQADVERGIDLLPTPTVVWQSEQQDFYTEWSPESQADEDECDEASQVIAGNIVSAKQIASRLLLLGWC